MTKILANPFFVYVISFSLVLSVYSLGWSSLYPDLSISLIVFFLLTFIISTIFGIALHALKRIDYKVIGWNERTKVYLLFIWVGFFFEFQYNKGIPFLMLLQGVEYDYTLFGIPVFHVFLVSFSSFLSVHIFHQLCSDFSRRRLVFFLLSIFPSILIINRGMLMIILISCLFVYLLSLKRIGIKRMAGVIFFVLFVFYLFGVMGNFRQSEGKDISSKYIMEIGQATESFRNSIIPKEYIWSYLYISSPLANLQNTIDKAPEPEFNLDSFLAYEILPDFISKRIVRLLELDRKTTILIAPWLTVGTLYSNSFLYLGWIGMILLFCFFLITTFSYTLILKKNGRYYVTGLAILSTLVLFNTFDNMYYFSGLNLQLIYPVLLSILSSLNVKLIPSKM